MQVAGSVQHQASSINSSNWTTREEEKRTGQRLLDPDVDRHPSSVLHHVPSTVYAPYTCVAMIQ